MAKSKKRKKSSPKPSQSMAQTTEKENKPDVAFIVMIVLIIAIVAALAVGIIIATLSGSGDETQQSSQSQGSEVSQTVMSPDSEIDPDKLYSAQIKIKDYGTISVQLDQSAAPITVDNFISLANSGFYNGLTFHRIMEGFMMQGGDPKGNGTGGSEKTIKGEFSANGVSNPLSHTRGAISMARNSYDMDSASSQFFIVQTDDNTASLDGNYAAFGYVTEGMDIVDRICADAQPIDNNGTIPTAEQPVIESITITEAAKN